MKTTTFLLLLFFSSFAAFSQDNTCMLRYRLGTSLSFWSSDNSVEGSICKGGRLKITCELIQNSVYVWRKNGEIIPNENKEFIYTAEEGVYIAEVQTSTCKYVSPKITCRIHNQLESYGINIYDVLNHPKLDEYVICDKGETFAPDLNAIFYGEVLYQWQKDGVDIDGATNKSFRIKESGVYNVRAQQGECRSNSKPIRITIADKKVESPIQFAQGYSYNFKPNDTLNLCENTNIRLTGFNNFGNYKWYRNNELLETDGNRLVDIRESGVYHYETKLPGGCEVSSNRIFVNFGKPVFKPVIKLGNSILACNSSYLTIYNAKENALFYSIISSSDAPYSLTWHSSDSSKQSGGATYANHTGIRTYNLTGNMGNCSVSSEPFIFDADSGKGFRLESALIKDGKVTMCGGNMINLSMPGNISKNYTIQWYKDNLPIAGTPNYLVLRESGRYHAMYILENDACRKYTDTIEVTMTKVPVNRIAKQISNCNYRLSVEKEDGINYAWKKDGKLINGANTTEFFPNKSGNYSLVSNNGYCSYESNIINIQLIEKSALTEKTSFCENDTLKLKAPEADSYLWQGPDNFTFIVRNFLLPNLKPGNSGLYKLTVYIGDCAYKDSVSIKVNTRPEVSIDRADEYCFDKNISMIARAENAYFSWVGPKQMRISSAAIVLPNANKSHEGIYTVTATNNTTGCSASAITKVMLKDAPCNSIELLLSKVELCAYTENELEFKINGSFQSDEIYNLYSINSNGSKSLLASATKSPIRFTPALTGSIVVVIESSKSKTYSNIVKFNSQTVSYAIQSDFTQACNGYSVPLKIDSVKFKFDRVQWVKDGRDIPNANGYAYYAAESGNYYVKVVQNGCVSSDSLAGHVDIKIGEIETPQISARFKTFNVCDSITTHLVPFIRSIGNFKLQWQLNGKDIVGATENLYIAKQQGDYTLKITQGTCQAISNTERLSVFSPQINISPVYWDQNGVAEICEGAEFDLESPVYTNPSSKGIMLQWQKDNIDIPSAESFRYRAKEEGKYRLKIVRGSCITFSNTILVKYGKPKLVKFNLDYKEYCAGEEITTSVWWSNDFLRASQKSTIYRDNKPFTESGYHENFKIKETGNYHAELNFNLPNSTKVCTAYSDTIKIAFKDDVVNYEIRDFKKSVICADSMFISGGTWGSTYKPQHQWKFNGNNLAEANDYIINAKKSGTYQLETKTPSGCAYLSNPINVQFKKLYPQIIKSWPLCTDTLQVLSVNVSSIAKESSGITPYGLISYEWQLYGKVVGVNWQQNVLKSGIYKIIAKDGECSGVDSILVDTREMKVNIPKNLTPNQDSLYICPLSSVSIEAPKGDYTYTWLKNNELFANNQTQSIRASTQGVYKIWMESKDCARMSNAVVVKEKIILPEATLSGSKEILSGDSVKLKVDLTSLPPWTIKLTNDQEFIANATPFEFSVKPLQTTVYELASVKNDCGVGTVNGKAEIKIIILGNEELAGAKINLYPVPTQGICQLSVETNVPEKLGFQLYNVEGKMLMKSEESKSGKLFTEVINLETMPDGVYVLKIKVGAKVVSRKIIKGN